MKFKKRWLIIPPVLILIVIYFVLFFQSGLWINNEFCRKKSPEDGIVYKGQDISIKVLKTDKEHGKVIYRYDKKTDDVEYVVEWRGGSEYGIRKLAVFENWNIIFKGEYDGENLIQGEESSSDWSDIIIDQPNDPKEKLVASDVVKLCEGKTEFRGNVFIMIFAICLLVIWIIDITFPKAFFYLQHALTVDNPKPSELYCCMQRILWVVDPIIVGIVLYVSLNAC